MMTPETFMRDAIFHWEDGKLTNPVKTHSMTPADAGNWSGGKVGVGQLIGSNHGVTATTLAAFRGVPLAAITVAVMHALTLDEAAAIALKSFYRANRLDKLAWNAITASVMDFGWGAGPITTVKSLQRLIGAPDTGFAGNVTIGRYADWLAARSLEAAAARWAGVRNDHYESVILAKPSNAQFRNGWRNRTAYFTPGDPETWWTRFAA